MKQKRGGVEQKRTWKKGRSARTIYGGVIAEGRGLYTVVGGRSSRATWWDQMALHGHTAVVQLGMGTGWRNPG